METLSPFAFVTLVTLISGAGGTGSAASWAPCSKASRTARSACSLAFAGGVMTVHGVLRPAGRGRWRPPALISRARRAARDGSPWRWAWPWCTC